MGSVGDVVTSIPAMMGFVPSEALCVVSVIEREGRRVIGGMYRAGAADVDAARCAVLLESLGARGPVVALIAVGVCAQRVEAARVVGACNAAAEGAGVPLVAGVHVAAIEAGREWVDLLSTDFGTLGDPWACEMTAAHVLGGRSVVATREGLRAELARGPEAQAVAGASADGAAGLFARVLSGEVDAVDDACVLGAGAVVVATRDEYLRVGKADPARAWQSAVSAAAVLRGEQRVAMLTVAAFFAALSGDGARANTALEVIESETAGDLPSLARLLDRVLQAGAPPELLMEAVAPAPV